MTISTADLVTEIGGIPAHGSIVERGYGMSAVTGVNGATQRIVDGYAITVDGDRCVFALMQRCRVVDSEIA